MSKTWKWILGILLALVLVGAMFAIGWMWQPHMATGWSRAMPFDHNWNNPMYRMMDGRGFAPFGGFFLLGGLARLALFFGLLYGAYWLGRRNARITLDPAPATRVDASAPPKADPASAPK